METKYSTRRIIERFWGKLDKPKLDENAELGNPGHLKRSQAPVLFTRNSGASLEPIPAEFKRNI